MLAKMIRLALLDALALTALAMFNSTRGFGQDVQHLGWAISRVAS